MAIEIDAVMQVITQAVIETTKAVVQTIMTERGDETTRHRIEGAGMRPKLGGPKMPSIWEKMWEVCQDEPFECSMQKHDMSSTQIRARI